jgi:hypothetical protein
MDETYTGTPVSGARSAEEAAWDEEFNNTRGRTGVGSTLGEVAKLSVQVPGAVASMTASMFPQDTRRHARAAVREGFLAVRSLLGAIGDGIESALSDKDATGSARQPLSTSGPAGTWGTAPSAASPTPTGARARRIEISDLDTTGTPTASTGDDEDDAPDERGLRADIDY